MHISKLELFGFKSFAKKQTILLDSGVTGIVGPNGCGKTNIVDAIRWVLGEQKTSRLRSSKMEDVIFNSNFLKAERLCDLYLFTPAASSNMERLLSSLSDRICSIILSSITE